MSQQSLNLSADQIAAARAEFTKADKDNSGTIDMQELSKLLESTLSKTLSPALYQKYVSSIMDLTDQNKNKVIEFDEFLRLYARGMSLVNAAAAPKTLGMRKADDAAAAAPGLQRIGSLSKLAELTPQEVEDARAEFKKADKDGSGSIDLAEMKALLESMQGKTKMSKLLFDRLLNGIMADADKDNSGEIDFDEFLKVYRRIFKQADQPPIGMMLPGMRK